MDYLGWGDRSGSTDPTTTEVETLIEQNEDIINKRTGHAWKSTTVTNEYQDLEMPWEDDAGYPLHLKHRTITTLSSGTDKIEIWNGNSWVDWVASSTYTEGRSSDFWLKYEQGVLYIRHLNPKKRGRMRLTYRYGEATVDKGIKKLCTLLTARDLAKNEDYRMNYAEGAEGYPLGSKMPSMEDEIERLFRQYSEVVTGI
jgi:hypothetical protein